MARNFTVTPLAACLRQAVQHRVSLAVLERSSSSSSSDQEAGETIGV